jgi:transcriptional regulator with XRE-family HTH domain
MKEIGKRIKNIRAALNLTQKSFSEKLNISKSSFSEIESGKYKPGLDIIVKLTKEFDVNLYYILLGEGDMFITPDLLSITQLKEYAVNEKHVREFLYYFRNSTTLQYYILSEFHSRMTKDKEIIRKEAMKKK